MLLLRIRTPIASADISYPTFQCVNACCWLVVQNAVKNRWNSSARKRWPKEFGTTHASSGLPAPRRPGDAGVPRPPTAQSNFSSDVLQQYVSNLTAFSRALHLANIEFGQGSTVTEANVNALSSALTTVGLLPPSSGVPSTPAQNMFSKLLLSLPNCAPSASSSVLTADQVRALLAWHSKMIGMLHKGMEPSKASAAVAAEFREDERSVLPGVSPTTSDTVFRDPVLSHSPVTLPPTSTRSTMADGFFGMDFASPWGMGPSSAGFNLPSLNGVPASYSFDTGFPFAADFQAPSLDINLDDNIELPSLSATFNTGSPFMFGTPTSPTAVKLAMSTWSPSRFVNSEELSFCSPPREGWQKTFAEPRDVHLPEVRPADVPREVLPPAAPTVALPPLEARPAPAPVPRALTVVSTASQPTGEPWEIMSSPMAVGGVKSSGSDTPFDLDILVSRNQMKTMTLRDVSPPVTPDIEVETSASSGSFAARRAAKGKALPPPLDGIAAVPVASSGPSSATSFAAMTALPVSAPLPSPATEEVRMLKVTYFICCGYIVLRPVLLHS